MHKKNATRTRKLAQALPDKKRNKKKKKQKEEKGKEKKGVIKTKYNNTAKYYCLCRDCISTML